MSPTYTKKRVVIPGLLFMVLMAPFFAQASEVITLGQALTIAMKRNPSLTASRSEVSAARARVTQTKAAYFPQLNASAGVSRTWNNPGSESSGAGSVITTDKYATGVSLTQYLFDFGKTPAQVEGSRQVLGATEKNLETVEQTLVRDVKQAYFEVLKNKQLVLVGNENLDVRKQQLEQAHALYRQGLNPKIDVTRGEVEVSQARLALAILAYGQREATIAFEKLLGGPPVAGGYSLAEEIPAPDSPTDLEGLINTALDSRPDLESLQAQVKAAEANLLAVKRDAYPVLNASSAYAYEGEGLPLEDQNWQAGVYLSWPIFTGFRQTGEVNESKAVVNRLLAQVDSGRLSVKEEVSKSYFLLQTARETIRNAEVVLEQARENLNIAQGRYKAGVSDFIELSDAQVLYTEARSVLVQVTYERHKAQAGLAFAVGDQSPVE